MRILIEEYPGSVDAARFLIAARDAGVPGRACPPIAGRRRRARPSPCSAAPPACCVKRGATTSPPGRARYPRPKIRGGSHLHIHRPFQRRLACPRMARRRASNQIAFELARDLPAREQPYSEAEIDAAVGGARLALEVLGCRYALPEHASLPELLADHMFNRGLVLGPRIASADDAPASMTITLSVDGQDAEQHAGIHPNGPRPVCTGWRTSCVNKAPACAPASMSSLARMPASWTCRRARSRDRLRRPGRAAPALRSARLNRRPAPASTPVARMPRGVTWRMRPATMLTLRPLTAEDHSLLAGWFSSLADRPMGRLALSIRSRRCTGNHAVGRPEHAARAPLLDGLPRWRAGRTCAARL